MRKPILSLLIGLTLAGCQPQSPGGATSATPPGTQPATNSTPAGSPSGATTASATPAASAFSQKLEMAGTTFSVECPNQTGANKVTITPAGLEIDNAAQTVDIEGTVTGAEVADLDVDGFPEVYVYTRGAGESATAGLIALASNKGKSLSMISLPPLADVPEVGPSYHGGDEFAVLEGRLGQRFPSHGPDGKPTGKTKQIQWKLQPGEASWQLVVDQITEF
jgi:hypothetical protein